MTETTVPPLNLRDTMKTETNCDVSCFVHYRVIARRSYGEVREEFFRSRRKAERLMEMLVEQGFAVMLQKSHRK